MQTTITTETHPAALVELHDITRGWLGEFTTTEWTLHPQHKDHHWQAVYQHPKHPTVSVSVERTRNAGFFHVSVFADMPRRPTESFCRTESVGSFNASLGNPRSAKQAARKLRNLVARALELRIARGKQAEAESRDIDNRTRLGAELAGLLGTSHDTYRDEHGEYRSTRCFGAENDRRATATTGYDGTNTTITLEGLDPEQARTVALAIAQALELARG